MKDFYVIAPISNPRRYRSRYRLYEEFAQTIAVSGATLLTIEVAFGERPFAVTAPGNPWHVQLRTRHELWHKENMINIALGRLPADWEYVAWIDADVAFARKDWASETVHKLQHHPFVQLFSMAMDLGPCYEPFQKHRGFAWSYRKASPIEGGHPGFAWAGRREAIDQVGGLFDVAILGGGDRHMAAAMVGRVETSIPASCSPAYAAELFRWQERCQTYIRSNVGYVDGLLLHYWHGKKRNRGYGSRREILTRNHYDPNLDLKKDCCGLWQLADRNHQLRHEIAEYFSLRDEDSIDLDEKDVRIH
jgi:hypothetical protein